MLSKTVPTVERLETRHLFGDNSFTLCCCKALNQDQPKIAIVIIIVLNELHSQTPNSFTQAFRNKFITHGDAGLLVFEIYIVTLPTVSAAVLLCDAILSITPHVH